MSRIASLRALLRSADWERLNRGRRGLMGSLWAVIAYAWYPVLLLVTTRFFIDRLGADAYGHWALLSATIGFGAILSTGTGAATVRAISHGIAAHDEPDVELLVRSSLAVALAGGAVLAFVIFLVFAFGSSTLFARMGAPETILLTGATAAIITLVEQLDNAFTSVLRGGERFRMIAMIEVWVRSLQIALTLGAVAIWGSLFALYAALLVSVLLRLGIHIVVVQRWLSLKSLWPALAQHRAIVRDAGWGWLQGSGAMVFGVADRFIVGSALGAAALAHYAVATQLAQPLHAFAAAAASVVFPKVSRALAQGDPARIQRLIAKGLLLLGMATTIGAAVLFVFRLPILTFWLGPDIAAASAPTLGLLAVAYWLLSFSVLPHFILLGLGRMRFVALANLGAGVLTLGAMLLLVGTYGIVGVAAARIVYGVTLLVNFAPLRRFWLTHARPS